MNRIFDFPVKITENTQYIPNVFYRDNYGTNHPVKINDMSADHQLVEITADEKVIEQWAGFSILCENNGWLSITDPRLTVADDVHYCNECGEAISWDLTNTTEADRSRPSYQFWVGMCSKCGRTFFPNTDPNQSPVNVLSGGWNYD